MPFISPLTDRNLVPITMQRFVQSLCLLVAAAAAGAANSAPAAEGPSSTADLFPFSLPSDDVTEGVTNLAFLNARPADELVSVADGHFQAGGRRVRFWPTADRRRLRARPRTKRPKCWPGVWPPWAST